MGERAIMTDVMSQSRTEHARILGKMAGRLQPHSTRASSPPDPRQEERVIRGVQRALIAAGESYGRLAPHALKSEFGWSKDLGDLGTVMPGDGLVALLDAQSAEPSETGHGPITGAVALSSGVVDALVEVQTTGAVEAHSGPARPVTRVDIVLVRDFIDLLLAGCAREFGAFQARDWPLRMSLGDPVEERHRLPLILEERDYHLWKIDLELGGGLKQGQIALIMPVIGRADAVAEAPKKQRKLSGAETQAWRASWARVIGEGVVALNAVLMRRKMPFVEVEALEVGYVLPFTDAALSDIRLEDLAGRAVLRGRLGQKSGMRAVRLGGAARSSLALKPAPMMQEAPPLAPMDLPDMPPSPIPDPMPVPMQEPPALNANDA